MIDITIVNGVYKPTYNWGAPHCIHFKVNDGQGPTNPSHPKSWALALRPSVCSEDVSGLNPRIRLFSSKRYVFFWGSYGLLVDFSGQDAVYIGWNLLEDFRKIKKNTQGIWILSITPWLWHAMTISIWHQCEALRLASRDLVGHSGFQRRTPRLCSYCSAKLASCRRDWDGMGGAQIVFVAPYSPEQL